MFGVDCEIYLKKYVTNSFFYKDEDAVGRIVFMSDAKVARGEPNQTPLCTLNLVLPKDILPERDSQSDLLSLDKDHSYLHHGGISKFEHELFLFYFV